MWEEFVNRVRKAAGREYTGFKFGEIPGDKEYEIDEEKIEQWLENGELYSVIYLVERPEREVLKIEEKKGRYYSPALVVISRKMGEDKRVFSKYVYLQEKCEGKELFKKLIEGWEEEFVQNVAHLMWEKGIIGAEELADVYEIVKKMRENELLRREERVLLEKFKEKAFGKVEVREKLRKREYKFVPFKRYEKALPNDEEFFGYLQFFVIFKGENVYVRTGGSWDPGMKAYLTSFQKMFAERWKENGKKSYIVRYTGRNEVREVMEVEDFAYWSGIDGQKFGGKGFLGIDFDRESSELMCWIFPE